MRSFFERADERLDEVWVGGWGCRFDVEDLGGVADDGGYCVLGSGEESSYLESDLAVASEDQNIDHCALELRWGIDQQIAAEEVAVLGRVVG